MVQIWTKSCSEVSGQVNQVPIRQRNDCYLKRVSLGHLLKGFHQTKVTKSTACVCLNIKDTGCVVVQELGTSKQDHPAPRRSFCLCLCFCFCHVLFLSLYLSLSLVVLLRKRQRASRTARPPGDLSLVSADVSILLLPPQQHHHQHHRHHHLLF